MDVELNEAQVAYAQAILECGLIELEPLQEWLSNLSQPPTDLGEALSAARLVNEFELTSTLAKGLGLSVANEIELEMYAAPHPLIPREVCVELLFVPLSDQQVSPFPIACSNPLDEVGLNYIGELIGEHEIKVSLSAPSQIRAEITACYGTEEEWREYLQSQGLAPESTIEPEESLAFTNEESENHFSTVDQDGRPHSIPDWSSRCTDAAMRILQLNTLFERG